MLAEANQSFVNFFDKKTIKVALVGNPNSGKSTLFNALTGLSQKTGNFPGVTIDKKTGSVKLKSHHTPPSGGGWEGFAEFIDLPGTYSLYPKSPDEQVTFDVLCNSKNTDHPDVVVVVADASNLKRNLFLVSQIVDLKIPTILVLNMMDLVEKHDETIDILRLSELLRIKVLAVSARAQQGIEELKQSLLESLSIPGYNFIDVKKLAPQLVEKISSITGVNNDFVAFHTISNFSKLESTNKQQKQQIALAINDAKVDITKLQSQETIERYDKINVIVDACLVKKHAQQTDSFTNKLDKLLTHPIWGYVIFLLILFLVFQTIFFLASYPMDWIENTFLLFSDWVSSALPPGELSSLLVNGVIAGLSGVVIFVPQIALLFTFIAILEDTGYMARVSFIMDKLMRKFGLNGRSVIPLVSGVACAIPAIMSTRIMSNWKERLITIMVTPLMSCSARLPVYTLLIALVVPAQKVFGFFNYQGLVLMGLYLIGFVAAMFAAWVMKHILKSRERSYFIMELPVYRSPQWRTVALTIVDKVKSFLWDAGKIILAVSIILWYLASHAPGNTFEQIEKKYQAAELIANIPTEDLQAKIASEQLEASYAGILGKTIEPAIAPLGFDWKIGIALITSFAAREVFVGTMATIYSSGSDDEDTQPLRQKMQAEINPSTGLPQFTVAVGFSLMLFYAFAMQCMSTLAVVFRETKHWKWPVIQFVFMSCLAYLSSLLVYQLLK